MKGIAYRDNNKIYLFACFLKYYGSKNPKKIHLHSRILETLGILCSPKISLICGLFCYFLPSKKQMLNARLCSKVQPFYVS